MFGRATIRLGIGPHSSSFFFMIGIQQQTFFVACADNSNVILLKLVNYISM